MPDARSGICHGTQVGARAQTPLNASWKLLEETLNPEEREENHVDWIFDTSEVVAEFKTR